MWSWPWFIVFSSLFVKEALNAHHYHSHPLKATSHTRLKARDYRNLRALIGRKGGDRPSSRHIRRWRPKGPKKKFMDEKSTWNHTWQTMDKVFMVSHNFCQAHLQEVDLTKNGRDQDFLIFLPSRIDFMKNYKVDSITYSGLDKHHQVFLSNWKTLRHNISNQVLPSFPPPPQQNMQWSHNMVHLHFTLSLWARDYIKWLCQHPWYGIWMGLGFRMWTGPNQSISLFTLCS